MTSVTDFDYYLPKELIAQSPANPRESARMMVLSDHTRQHTTVSELPIFFRAGDVVVINNSKVFNARLKAKLVKLDKTQRQIEVFLIKPVDETDHSSIWQCLVKPGKAVTIGSHIEIAPQFTGDITHKAPDGTVLIQFPYTSSHVIDLANQFGSVPLPPYIKTKISALEYQTSYASVIGSVAAPTAGFHLTPAIRQQLSDLGVIITEITLHVGLGTFLPVKSEQIEDHIMHSEWIHISEDNCAIINQAKSEHRRIIAIGTTVVRALEGTFLSQKNALSPIEPSLPKQIELQPYIGDINIFITPGFQFHIIDGLLTNFHLPKSTLLMLVSALVGKEVILSAYREAVEKQYRFFSFGDCMLLLPTTHHLKPHAM